MLERPPSKDAGREIENLSYTLAAKRSRDNGNSF